MTRCAPAARWYGSGCGYTATSFEVAEAFTEVRVRASTGINSRRAYPTSAASARTRRACWPALAASRCLDAARRLRATVPRAVAGGAYGRQIAGRKHDCRSLRHDPTPEQRVNCEANGVPGGSYVQARAIFISFPRVAIRARAWSRVIHSTWGGGSPCESAGICVPTIPDPPRRFHIEARPERPRGGQQGFRRATTSSDSRTGRWTLSTRARAISGA